MQTDAMLKVSPRIPHVWVDSDTGVLGLQNHDEKTTLTQMVQDGYVAISGSQYVPQQSTTTLNAFEAPTRFQTGRATVSLPRLKHQIERKLDSLDDEQLLNLMTDQATFMQELQAWLKETDVAKQHVQVHTEKVQAAQSNKDLMAVRICSVVLFIVYV